MDISRAEEASTQDVPSSQSPESKRYQSSSFPLRIPALVALLNIVVLLWFACSFPPDTRGVGTILNGRCSTVAALNGTFHIIINVLTGLCLWIGNHCMQLSVSPTRHEIDRAYSSGVCLKIGVLNVTNLSHINRMRVIKWTMIGLPVVLLHTM